MKTRTQITKELSNLSLSEERRVLRELKSVYQAASRRCAENIKILLANGGDQLQSRIYQAQWQQALKEYIDNALQTIQSEGYQYISQYLNGAYEDGFLGAVYSMQAQGVPLIFPVDARQLSQAILNETRLSRSLYETLGINVADLQNQVRRYLTIGIASGESYAEISTRLNQRMNIGLRNTNRIVRTEGHRVQAKATLDAVHKAADNGAEVMKEWIATQDSRTRADHRYLDRQLREPDEPFEVNGHRAQCPGAFGVASEDINCRCRLGQRAKWAVEYEERIRDSDVRVQSVEAGSYKAWKTKAKEIIGN